MRMESTPDYKAWDSAVKKFPEKKAGPSIFQSLDVKTIRLILLEYTRRMVSTARRIRVAAKRLGTGDDGNANCYSYRSASIGSSREAFQAG